MGAYIVYRVEVLMMNVWTLTAATLYTGAPDFHDGVQRAGEYRYDRCGRMVADDNRSIRSVAYNYLGLPSRIVMDHSATDSVVIARKYRADGVLMSETTGMPYTVTLPGAGWGVNVPIIPGHPIGGGTPCPGTTGLTRQTVTRNFVGSYVLRGTTLERIATAYGYLQGDSAAVRIYTRDLQGNIRAVTDLAGNLLQTNHYYPYGMPFGEAVAPQLPRFGSDVQHYRFSGHRYIQTSGLNLCDFPARPYNPATANFWGPDSNSDNYPHLSPWLYCAANPLNAIDPQGELIIFINGFCSENTILSNFVPKCGGPSYWGMTNHNGHTKYLSNFIPLAQNFFNDSDIFIPNINYSIRSSALQRYNAGYAWAKTNFDDIKGRLSNDSSVKFISHSMGAAFSKGAEAFLKENGIAVEYNIMINAYQIKDIPNTQSNTIDIDFKNTNDPVIFAFDTLPSTISDYTFKYININYLMRCILPILNQGDNNLRNADRIIRKKSNQPITDIHSAPIWDECGSFWNTISAELWK